jgi:EAL domain-containing protein (putative c-di-GMP-specific phosphodiesterase class I)
LDKQWILESVAADGSRVTSQIRQFPFRIGRDADNDLVVAAVGLSRRHAVIHQDISALLRLTDLNSTNGTFVNRVRLEGSCLLKDGDIVHFGSAEFRIQHQTLQAEETYTHASMHTMLIQPGATLSEYFVPHEEEFHALLAGSGLGGAAQPIVRTEDGSIFAYELLGRAKLPPLPDSPIRLFELAHALGKEVELSVAFREYGLRKIAPHLLGIPIFVNTHPKETFTDEFFRSTRRIVELFPKLDLVVEVHETVVTETQQMKALAERFRGIGVRFAYDDFGAGQARLAELGDIPADFVKFDMGLIREIDRASSRKRRVVSDLVKLVLDFGSTPVAEGVETEEEAHICREIGFPLIQGFLTGRPIPVEHFGK